VLAYERDVPIDLVGLAEARARAEAVNDTIALAEEARGETAGAPIPVPAP